MRKHVNFSGWLTRASAVGLVILLTVFSLGALRGRAVTVAPPEPVKLRVDGLAANESFGYSVALDGDLLLVGARLMTINGQQGQGAAFLFTRDAGDPLRFNLLKQLTASDGAAFDEFGQAVAIDGDTLVVGASHADPNDQFDVGAAYVFERNQGGANNWGQVAKLVDANFNEFSEHGYLGESVAIRGDIVVVGAPRNRGRAFLFGRDQGGSGQWGELQVLGPQNYWEGGEFGAAVALDGARIYIGGSRSSMVGGRANAEGAVLYLNTTAQNGNTPQALHCRRGPGHAVRQQQPLWRRALGDRQHRADWRTGHAHWGSVRRGPGLCFSARRHQQRLVIDRHARGQRRRRVGQLWAGAVGHAGRRLYCLEQGQQRQRLLFQRADHGRRRPGGGLDRAVQL
ncbi:MAG: FG-GAP repeat protein [Caldilineaceae bacterium]